MSNSESDLAAADRSGTALASCARGFTSRPASTVSDGGNGPTSTADYLTVTVTVTHQPTSTTVRKSLVIAAF